jgi:cob(I)alamin adenosyltransferase
MEKKTLSDLDNYLNEIESELKTLQAKLGVNLDSDSDELGEINLEEADINRLTEIFDTINNKFNEIELDSEDDNKKEIN